MHTNQDLAHKLTMHGIKVTPQRIAVLQTLLNFRHHLTAEEIFKEVSTNIPGLSQATVYNTLDVFVKRGIACKIATNADVMRYDVILEPHHHLFDVASNRVVDYYDPELDQILKIYFSKKRIKGFRPLEIKLHLTGKFEELS
ncbi:MAG TPA: Fur family transcriptional regulator [Bacteroidales bacterium]|nr:Fur family transcriptional regulator [Bacteroidales bacterium]